MRQKTERLIVTFPSTAAAMAMERRARELAAPGRLIPPPTVVTADCGLAWMAPPEAREQVEDLLSKNGLQHSEVLCLWL